MLTLKDLRVGETFRYADGSGLMVKTDEGRAIHLGDGLPAHDAMSRFCDGIVRCPVVPAEDFESEKTSAEIPSLRSSTSVPAAEPPAIETGIRFHHFLDAKTGAIRATLVTKDSPEERAAWAAIAVCNPKDVGTRAGGRREALKKLHARDCVLVTLNTLKKQISDRTILKFFSVSRHIDLSTIRPRKPYASDFRVGDEVVTLTGSTAGKVVEVRRYGTAVVVFGGGLRFAEYLASDLRKVAR